MKYLILLNILFFNLTAQSGEVEITSKTMTPNSLLALNFDLIAYKKYQQQFEDSIDSYFSNWDDTLQFQIYQTFDAKNYPYYSIASKPALPLAQRNDLLRFLMQIPAINSDYLPFSLVHYLKVNGGETQRGLNFSPVLEKPHEAEIRAYEFADLATSFNLIKNWVANEALPMLVNELKNKQGDFEATRKWAEKLENINTTQLGYVSERYTNRLQLYWQAKEEAANSYDYTLCIKILLLAQEGRYKFVQEYINYVVQYEALGTVNRYLIDELYWRVQYYMNQEQLVLANSDNTTNENYIESINKQAKTVLKVNENSSSALNLIYQFDNSEYKKNDHRTITPYFSNPMQLDTFTATSKMQAYQNSLRKDMVFYFQDPESYQDDYDKYALKAMQLENYAVAADLYWYLYKLTQPTDNNAAIFDFYTAQYAFAKHQLGQYYPGDKKEKKRFKRKKKRLKKSLKKNPYYKNFKS